MGYERSSEKEMKYESLLSILMIMALLAAIVPIAVISSSLAQPPPPPPSENVKIDLTADTYIIQVEDISKIRAAVTNLSSGNPEPNMTVDFTTTLGTITASNKTDTNGVAIASLQAGTSGGSANVTAVVGTIPSNTITVNIMGPTPTPGTTPSPGVTATPTPTPTPAATVTVTSGVNVTPSPSPEVTPTVSPSVNVTPTLSVTVSPTPEVTPTVTATPTARRWIPGFEAVFAIAGLLSIAYLVLRRRRR